MAERIILHCDANSFFASVELLFHPEYKDAPVAVCGSEEERRGIVLAKNAIAKKYGIETAETVYSAKKKCPQLVILSPHYDQYVKYSRELNRIYERYTDRIEPFGIDESWLDVTGSQRLFGGGLAIAERIRHDVRTELGLTVSIGVSFNKVFAKLGSDYKKPDGITEITRENMWQIVHPLPVGALLFIGRRTIEALEKMGIKTIGDLAAAGSLFLEKRFGKHGATISSYARGEDDSPVLVPSEQDRAKSIGSGMTFSSDLIGEEAVRRGLMPLCEEVAAQLRYQNRVASTLSLTVRDEFLRTISRQIPLTPPTDLAKVLLDRALELYRLEWSPQKPIRMLTVTAMNLCEAEAEQITLFDEEQHEKRQKRRDLEKTVDEIRSKYGKDALSYGKNGTAPSVRRHRRDEDS